MALASKASVEAKIPGRTPPSTPSLVIGVIVPMPTSPVALT
jgi:hypothetical protein